MLIFLKPRKKKKKFKLFKIACLREIRTIFHPQEGFYAGFGNKDTVLIKYR